MRKAPVVLAALWAALVLLVLPSSLEARPARGGASHGSPTRHVIRKKPAHKKAKAKMLIHQNGAGNVVIDRLDVVVLNFYGPPFPAEVHNYPQPLCDPSDTVAEVRVHDAEAGNPDTFEVETAEVTREVTDSESRHGLSRIAHKLGSFFRPKSGQASVRPQDVDLDVLLSQRLLIPVEGVNVEKLRDSFLSQRGKYAQHLAIDIGSPRGTPVLASTDGQIVKVTRERRGGKSIYQKDTTGKYLLFYCHLSGYAQDLVPGKEVHKGEVIGYVGATGHVIGGSHLHFSITRVPEDSANFKAGLAINPYLLFLAGVQ